MSKIILIMVALAVGCYFLGVGVGILVSRKPKKEEVVIQHVSYTPEQMGYDK